jgi:hypothetical protein
MVDKVNLGHVRSYCRKKVSGQTYNGSIRPALVEWIWHSLPAQPRTP